MAKNKQIIEFYGVQASGKTTLAIRLDEELKKSGVNSCLITGELEEYKKSVFKLFKLIILNNFKFFKLWLYLYKINPRIYKSAKRALLFLALKDIISRENDYETIILEEGILFYIYTYIQYSNNKNEIKRDAIKKLIDYLYNDYYKKFIIKIDVSGEKSVKRALNRNKNDNVFDDLEADNMCKLIESSWEFYDLIYDYCKCNKKIKLNGEEEIEKNISKIKCEIEGL